MASNSNDHNTSNSTPVTDDSAKAKSKTKRWFWVLLALTACLLIYNKSQLIVSESPDASDSDLAKAPATVSDNNKPVSNGGDVEGPEIESHLGDLDYMVGAFPPDNRPLIWAEYEDESQIDTESVHMFMDDKDITADCRVREGKVSFKPAKTLKAPKLYEFKVIVSDKAGNSSELVWEILLKPC